MTNKIAMQDFVLCRSDQGDGGWSLHAPGSTDAQIADGTAPALASGESDRWPTGDWQRPDDADYRLALDNLKNAQR